MFRMFRVLLLLGLFQNILLNTYAASPQPSLATLSAGYCSATPTVANGVYTFRANCAQATINTCGSSLSCTTLYPNLAIGEIWEAQVIAYASAPTTLYFTAGHYLDSSIGATINLNASTTGLVFNVQTRQADNTTPPYFAARTHTYR